MMTLGPGFRKAACPSHGRQPGEKAEPQEERQAKPEERGPRVEIQMLTDMDTDIDVDVDLDMDIKVDVDIDVDADVGVDIGADVDVDVNRWRNVNIENLQIWIRTVVDMHICTYNGLM